MNPALVLDEDQKKAFKALKRAFQKCHEVKIELHGELTTLYALNGRRMNGLGVTVGRVLDDDNNSVTDNAENIVPKCFYGCAADDGLSLISKYETRKPKHNTSDDQE